MTTLRSTPVGALAGTVRVPTDKSITHRALLLAAVSDRTVTITAPLDSADTGCDPERRRGLPGRGGGAPRATGS